MPTLYEVADMDVLLFAPCFEENFLKNDLALFVSRRLVFRPAAERGCEITNCEDSSVGRAVGF